MAAKGEPPIGQGPEMLVEHWLLHFCEKEEKKQLIQWMNEESLERPKGFDARVRHAERLRKMGNDFYNRSDLRRALHCTLGAVHCLDFVPAEQLGHDAEERQKVAKAMMYLMSNLAMIFLKRGDFINAEIAGSAGFKAVGKLEDEETTKLRAKLHYRRALAKGEPGPQHDIDGAREDLLEVLRLEPNNAEARKCLENCRDLRKEEHIERKKQAPRFPVPEEKEKEEASAAEGSGPAAPPELSPRMELFAECLGRFLGRWRRRCRYARGLARKGWTLSGGRAGQLFAATALLGPVLALGARHLLSDAASPERGQPHAET